MSSTTAVLARRCWTRSIQCPDRSASAVRFRSSVIALVSKRPTWLVDAACSVTARPPTIHRNLGRHRREAERIVEFPEREQPGIGGDAGTVEFELQPAVERDPQLRPFRFTRRVVHPPPPP
jgi:hypothetical protein